MKLLRISEHYSTPIDLIAIQGDDEFEMLDADQADSILCIPKKNLSLLVTDTMYGISGLVGDKRRSVYWRAACAIHAERLYIIAKTVFGIDTTDAFTKYVTENANVM